MTAKPPTPQAISALLAKAKVADYTGDPLDCHTEDNTVIIGCRDGATVRLEMIDRAERTLRRAGLRVERGWHGSHFVLIAAAKEDKRNA